MSDLWVSVAASAAGGGFIVASATVVRLLFERRQIAASTKKLQAEATSEGIDTVANLVRQWEELSAKYFKVLDRAEECDRNYADLQARFARLERLFPLALTAERLQHWEEFREVWDEATDGWVVSSPMNGGRILFANRALGVALDRTGEEIVALGWQSLIAKRDLARTQRVERSARLNPVRGFRNTYLRRDGAEVPLEWHTTVYTDSIAVSLVIIGTPHLNEVLAAPGSPQLPIREEVRP